VLLMVAGCPIVVKSPDAAGGPAEGGAR
jgi:hypothetical protein